MAATLDGAGPSVYFDDAGGAGAVIWAKRGQRWGKAAVAAAQVADCSNAVAAEARAAALAIELSLRAAIPGPR
eukprot:4305547-Alexandrium_andersonii.AAC.1